MLVHREESNFCSVLRITRVSFPHRHMERNLQDSFLFLRQFRSFVQNFYTEEDTPTGIDTVVVSKVEVLTVSPHKVSDKIPVSTVTWTFTGRQ